MADRAPTVEEAVKDYLAAERSRNAKTKSNAEEEDRFAQAYMALLHFADGIRSKAVSEMNAQDVARYAEQENLKGADAELRIRHVKDFLDYLKKKGLHETSLRVHVKIRPVDRAEKQTATVGVQSVEVTESGLEARKKELEDLKAQRPEVIAAIRRGDPPRRGRRDVRRLPRRRGRPRLAPRLGRRNDESVHARRPHRGQPVGGEAVHQVASGRGGGGQGKGNQVTIKTPSGGERRYRIEDIAF